LGKDRDDVEDCVRDHRRRRAEVFSFDPKYDPDQEKTEDDERQTILAMDQGE
jgi:hypothetical protein